MQKTNKGTKAAIAVLACTTVAFAALFGWQLTKNGQSKEGGATSPMK